MNKSKNIFRNYLSLVKFSHTIFAMPFAIIGYTIAITDLDFDNLIFLYVLLCMIFARNAAMAFNRYVDKGIDEKNPRTSLRELPSGIVSNKGVLFFIILNCILFIITTFFINSLCFYLSPVALVIILGYSLTKRFTFLCHFVLGIGLSLAPIGAYIAVAGEFALLPLMYSFVVLFWVSGFDIIYALQDESFDKNENLYSLPAYIGAKKSLFISRILHFLVLIFLLLILKISGFGYLLLIGVIIFSVLLFYQHRIVKPNQLSKVNIAFFTTNGIASIVFSIFVIADMILSI